MKLIERTAYLDKLKSLNGTPDVKVITGVRRSGKSRLMDSYIAWVEENDKNCTKSLTRRLAPVTLFPPLFEIFSFFSK